jgi:accessory gene regulator B
LEITFYRKLADKLADRVIDNQEYSEAEAKRIRYGLVCIFSDSYKFILYLIIFSVFSVTKEYLLAFSANLFLRPFLAGYHAKTEIRCIFISFITMLISIVVGKMNILPSYLEIALIIILPVIGLLIAPVRKDSNSKNNYYKIITCILTAIILCVDYYIIPYQILFISVLQVYLLAVYQMVKNYIINE